MLALTREPRYPASAPACGREVPSSPSRESSRIAHAVDAVGRLASDGIRLARLQRECAVRIAAGSLGSKGETAVASCRGRLVGLCIMATRCSRRDERWCEGSTEVSLSCRRSSAAVNERVRADRGSSSMYCTNQKSTRDPMHLMGQNGSRLGTTQGRMKYSQQCL